MKPNYSGRMLDKLLLIAAKQTSAVRPNPDDPEYIPMRRQILKDLTLAFWGIRQELQMERRQKK